MKLSTGITVAAAAAVFAIGAMYFIDVDLTQSAAIPEVDVSVKGGQLPKIAVETGSVDMSTKEVTVSVPKVTMWIKSSRFQP